MNTTLITGASSGIGAAFARKFAALGRNVFLVARSEDKLITICNELGRMSGSRAQYFALDLTEPDAAARLFEETQKRGLEIDMLRIDPTTGVGLSEFTVSSKARFRVLASSTTISTPSMARAISIRSS